MAYYYTCTISAGDDNAEIVGRLMRLQASSPDSIISISDNGDGTATIVTDTDLGNPLPEEEQEALSIERKTLLNRLEALDYIGVKIATGRASADDYADEIALMTEYAGRINEIDSRLAELQG